MFRYLLFIFSMPLGFFITFRFFNFKRGFSWLEFILSFSLPGLALYYLYLQEGAIVLISYFIFCIIGPLAESLVGITYLKLSGEHLWIYERYPLFNRTTSFLSIPYWGFVGTGVLAIEKFLKLFF